ncbi:flagellar biosynthesis anti-sigma factor FlgM [Chitiniphilus purpureus]|uniref:Negative regulator of flagellin synthesis n=1 Tax=Chitiniphilus purpureus TaxID=2981137 RepID=A0ABY6DRT2_9NEIS|nr:flagellar biosynthesis anti-sigma factor FlgM [Chitiniphilus sp. CD1]UXY17079.1 flagellar biosynthesis anti-sigma factor FlgM [Chitiniphilus sp. CD1]
MKIDHSGKSTLAPVSRNTERQNEVAKPTVAPAQDESVTLNPLAAQIGQADEAAPFDSARVQALRQAIAEGRFTVKPEAIADKLLASVQELLRD